MATTGLILEPCSGDTVMSPVIVKVAYTTTVPFSLACKVDVVDEAPPQPHPVGSDTHVGSRIASGSSGAGTFTASALNQSVPAPSSLDAQPGVKVLPAGGTPPVVVGGNSFALVRGKGKRKRRPVSGDTIANAVYVVCLIYEIDTAPPIPTRTLITVGAAMVKHTTTHHRWSVHVKFTVKKPGNFQYVARVTAYDLNNISLGTHTKQIKK